VARGRTSGFGGRLPQSHPQVDDLSLQQCADEPIHIPGSVQQHGFLLVVDEHCEQVLVASQNAERFLGRPLRLVLGARLADFLDREVMGALHLLRSSTTQREGVVTYLGTFPVHGEAFSIVTHPLGDRRILEFELQNRLVATELMNSVITNFVTTLGRLHNEEELFRALAQQIAELTGFDRVMVYSFDDEGHGTVLAETNNGRLPSYLDLRFPSTDIPAQARRLYTLNTVRIIPEGHYTPSPLVGLPGEGARELDLSLSVLRSVSPIHLEYMRNMGTLSSMSVSILFGGQLWGLVSGHHAEPKIVPYVVRSACDMLTRMASTQLNSFRTAALLKQTLDLHAVQRKVLTTLASANNYLDGLVQQLDHVQEIANAGGVVLLVDGHITRHGETPDEAMVERLVNWLESHGNSDVHASSHLAMELDWAGEDAVRATASGLLAVRISSVRRRWLLWFRPEVVNTVRWAGEPEAKEMAAKRLQPRQSFAEWKEIVRGRSEPWTETEIESAQDFRNALTTIGLRRAEEAMELGEARFQQLTQSLPVKIFTADDEGRLTYVNERWEVSGLSSTGKWFEEATLFPEDAELCRLRWKHAVEENAPFEAEVRLRSAPDAERWNFVRAVPFQRAGAGRAGWVGTFIDLTESKEREMALRMNEKLALTGRMTSVIAHEINNPLEAITNLMYLLRTELKQDGPAAGYIGMVESELERISGITKQTLRWNRETSDQSERFLAGAMTDDVLRLFAGKIRNRQITVHVAGNRDIALQGVLGQIRQVLANLVSNAIDAAPVGGHVSIQLLNEKSRTGFAVSDDGRGIPASVLQRLFEPFHSTKGDLGNGLGLYISKEIVERHAGTIDVVSSEQGTTMTVWLPCEAVD
jgi:PAS domain S-box-containing protein